MAKRRGKRRSYRRGGFKLPVGVIAGFIPLLVKASADVRAGGIAGLQNTVSAVVPFDPRTRRFTMANLSWGLYPILIGWGVHKLASMLGINRALAQAKVPFIRI